MRPVKTIAAVHDLSGVGRCALTVAIPVLSAMGVQACPAPTAVLSAHTAFPDYVSRDLTEYLQSHLTMWNRMGLRFDGVYTGYMADTRQIDITLDFLSAQTHAVKVVDPVLGDDGVMYRALPREMPRAMARLCAAADVITPNLTEASLLTGLNLYGSFEGKGALGTGNVHPPVDQKLLEILLERLMALGAGAVLLTGVNLEGVPVNAWTNGSGPFRLCAYEPVPARYPGTGDLFASVIAGALTRGASLDTAVQLATDYVRETMQVTLDCGTDPLNGVQLEKTLHRLIPPQEEIL